MFRLFLLEILVRRGGKEEKKKKRGHRNGKPEKEWEGKKGEEGRKVSNVKQRRYLDVASGMLRGGGKETFGRGGSRKKKKKRGSSFRTGKERKKKNRHVS